MDAAKPRSPYIYWMLLVIAVLLAIFPLFLLLTALLPDGVLLVMGLVTLGGNAFAASRSGEVKRQYILKGAGRAAALSLAALAVLWLWPKDGSLDRFTSSYIATTFKLDGERAYDAVMLEAFCEVWMFLAVFWYLAAKSFQLRKK